MRRSTFYWLSVAASTAAWLATGHNGFLVSIGFFCGVLAELKL